jgi:hypothetical protein
MAAITRAAIAQWPETETFLHPISLPTMIYMSTHPQLAVRFPFKWLLKARNQTDNLIYQQIAGRRGEAADSDRKDVLAMLMRGSLRPAVGSTLTVKRSGSWSFRKLVMSSGSSGSMPTMTCQSLALQMSRMSWAVPDR